MGYICLKADALPETEMEEKTPRTTEATYQFLYSLEPLSFLTHSIPSSLSKGDPILRLAIVLSAPSIQIYTLSICKAKSWPPTFPVRRLGAGSSPTYTCGSFSTIQAAWHSKGVTVKTNDAMFSSESSSNKSTVKNSQFS